MNTSFINLSLVLLVVFATKKIILKRFFRMRIVLWESNLFPFHLLSFLLQHSSCKRCLKSVRIPRFFFKRSFYSCLASWSRQWSRIREHFCWANDNGWDDYWVVVLLPLSFCELQVFKANQRNKVIAGSLKTLVTW